MGGRHRPRIGSEDRLCIPTARGGVYLAAVVDGASRRALSHRGSIVPGLDPGMEADFCVEALEEAVAGHGRPEIFDTGQGRLPGPDLRDRRRRLHRRAGQERHCHRP